MVVQSCVSNQEPYWLIDSILDSDENSKISAFVVSTYSKKPVAPLWSSSHSFLSLEAVEESVLQTAQWTVRFIVDTVHHGKSGQKGRLPPKHVDHRPDVDGLLVAETCG